MRRGIGNVLNERATVHRVTTTSDGAGGWVETWQQVATVAARVSQPHPAEHATADRSEAGITHDVYLYPNADVRRGDRLHVRGLVLDVAAVTVPSIAHHAKAACSSTQTEQGV